MPARTLLLSTLVALFLTAPARAQVTIQSLGDGPITLQRDDGRGLIVRGGKGSVLRVGGTTINSGGGGMEIINAGPVDVSQFLRPPTAHLDANAPAVSIAMRVSLPFDAAATDAERIVALTRLTEGLSAAIADQCKLAEAPFAAGCSVGYVKVDGRLESWGENSRAVTGTVRSEFLLAPQSAKKAGAQP